MRELVSFHRPRVSAQLHQSARAHVSFPARRNRHTCGQRSLGEDRIDEDRPGEVRVDEVHAGEVRESEVRAGEVRTVKERAGEVCTVKVCAGKVRGAELRPVRSAPVTSAQARSA